MQNRYTGDIGDFGKLGLLRTLQSCGLTIGVNWYLVPNENHNSDGLHTKYLENEKFASYDAPLWYELRHIVNSGDRKVAALENDRILKATFYSEPLDFRNKSKVERLSARREWHKAAVDALDGVDIVFVDPDNGLIVPSAKETPKENKYVLLDELANHYKRGSTVVYYQHKARKQDHFYTDTYKRLLSYPEFTDATGIGLKFAKTSHRFYFFIIQPRHLFIGAE